MKTLKLTLAALIAIASFTPAASFAESVEAETDSSVNAQLIDGFANVPDAGALRATVLSVYAGSAYSLEGYVVTVSNADAPVEGDLMDAKTFKLRGQFSGVAKAVYSRQIDKNTYSIAILTNLVDGSSGEAKYIPGKILLRVKFTAEGVANVAEMTTQKL